LVIEKDYQNKIFGSLIKVLRVIFCNENIFDFVLQ